MAFRLSCWYFKPDAVPLSREPALTVASIQLAASVPLDGCSGS